MFDDNLYTGPVKISDDAGIVTTGQRLWLNRDETENNPDLELSYYLGSDEWDNQTCLDYIVEHATALEVVKLAKVFPDAESTLEGGYTLLEMRAVFATKQEAMKFRLLFQPTYWKDDGTNLFVNAIDPPETTVYGFDRNAVRALNRALKGELEPKDECEED